MKTLHHPWDWYGKIKQERTTYHENAIQQSVRQEATKAQCQGTRTVAWTSCWFNAFVFARILKAALELFRTFLVQGGHSLHSIQLYHIQVDITKINAETKLNYEKH
jgi:hypothetical protein